MVFKMLALVITFRVLPGFKQVIVVKVMYAVYEALVFCMVLLPGRFFEGGRFEIQMRGGEAVVGNKLFGIIALSFLRDEARVLLVTGFLNLHQVDTN